MVNSKKMSKSSIAVIVLSILLVLSMILGLTGAWFTDKTGATKDDALQFGKIDIELTEQFAVSSSNTVELNNAKLMPGSTLEFAGEVTNKGQEAYVGFQVVLTFAESVQFAESDIQGLAGWSIDETHKNILKYDAGVKTLVAADADSGTKTIDLATALAGVKVPTGVTNTAIESYLDVTLNVVAIQTANNEAKNFDTYDKIYAVANVGTEVTAQA